MNISRYLCFRRPTPHSCAGAIFTNGTHILAGYQPNKKTPFISGIGGRMEPGEAFVETAVRESIEEILDVDNVSKKLIEDIIRDVKYKVLIEDMSYSIIVYTFEDLFNILSIAACLIKASPIYKKIPSNLEELLFERCPLRTSEISQLCLLPVVGNSSLFIDSNLVKDIILLQESKTL
jgi:hypothetical protein